MPKKTWITRGITFALAVAIAAESSAGQIHAERARLGNRAYLYDRGPSSDCPDGTCIPNPKQYGYYPTKWRIWPAVEPSAPGVGEAERRRATQEDLPAFELPQTKAEGIGEAAPPQEQKPAQGASVPRSIPRQQPFPGDQDAAPRPPKESENAPPTPPSSLFENRPLFEMEPLPETPPLRGPFRRRPSENSPNSSSSPSPSSPSPSSIVPFGYIPQPPDIVLQYAATRQRTTEDGRSVAVVRLVRGLSGQDSYRTTNPLRSTSGASLGMVTPTVLIEPEYVPSQVRHALFISPVPAHQPAELPAELANPLR